MQADGLLHAWDDDKWDFLGDWLTPHGSEADPKADVNTLFNNAYLHYITSLAANIADVLGRSSEAAAYRKRASALAAAINAKYYVASSGAYIDLLQTHLVMPLAGGVVPPARQAETMSRLEAAIATQGGHLDVGLTANYFMTKLFTERRRNDLMLTLTNRSTYPSYGYFLAQGYTSWPEVWNVKECCADQVSKMHGCYNAIGMWFIEGLAGIAVDFSRGAAARRGNDDAGPNDDYAVIQIQAGVDAGELMWASGSLAVPQGSVHSSWAVDVGRRRRFSHNVTIPGNAAARVLIPAASAADVLEDGKPLPADVKVLGGETINRVHYVALGVNAGRYAFSSSWVRGQP